MTGLARAVDVGGLLTPSPRSASAREALRLVERTGALLSGHFALQGGGHSPHFLRFSHVGRDRAACDLAARLLADELALPRAATVLCPESAGFLLGEALARRRRAHLAVAAIGARRTPVPGLRSGELERGRPVVVVNDVVSTGASLEPLLTLAREAEAPVAAVLVFATLDERRFHRLLAERDLLGAWLLAANGWPIEPGDSCAQCREGTPLVPASELNG